MEKLVRLVGCLVLAILGVMLLIGATSVVYTPAAVAVSLLGVALILAALVIACRVE